MATSRTTANPTQAGFRRQSTPPAPEPTSVRRLSVSAATPATRKTTTSSVASAMERPLPRIGDHPAEERRDGDPGRADGERGPDRARVGWQACVRDAADERDGGHPATRVHGQGIPEATDPGRGQDRADLGGGQPADRAGAEREAGRGGRPLVAGQRTDPTGRDDAADAGEEHQRDAGGLVVVDQDLEQAGEDRGPRRLGDERQADGHERERAARAPGSLVVRHRDTTRRSAVRQCRSIVARLASKPSDRARAASRCASGPAVIDDDVGTRALEPPEGHGELARVAGCQHEHGRAGPHGPRDHREQPLVWRGRVRREPREQVEDPLHLARRRRDGHARDARLRAGVARGHQPERDPPVAERPGQRSGDHVQRLDVVAPEPGLPGRPVDGLDVEGDQHLALTGRFEPLRHRLPDAGARAGMDPADRVARCIGADAGEPRRILGEAELREVEVAPLVGRLDLGGRDRPRPDEERVGLGTEIRGGQEGERVPHRQVHGPDPEHATPVGADVEPADHALPRSQRPRVPEHLGPGSAPSMSSRSRTVTPGVASSSACSQGSGSRRRFQTSTSMSISSPNAARRADRRRLYRTSRTPARAHASWTTSIISVTRPSRITIGTLSPLPITIRASDRRTRAATDRPSSPARQSALTGGAATEPEDRRQHRVDRRAVEACGRG